MHFISHSFQDLTVLLWIRLLRDIPPGVHWLCSRQRVDDYELYDDDDIEDCEADPAQIKRRKERKERKTAVLDFLEILAFDDAADYQNYFKENLNEQLRNCDICIRNYYTERKLYLNHLRR